MQQLTVFRTALVASLFVFAACRSEPAPTVLAPPNPTSAPSSFLAGCVVDQGAPSPAKSTGVDYAIAQPGILVAGSVASNPPFASLQAGRPVGFEVDMIAEIARRLGLRPEIQTETPSNVLTDVASGRTDVAISALSVRSDRRATVDFTDPYYTANLALTVAVGEARGFNGLQSLAGKVLGVVAGTTGESCARTALLARARLFSIRTYPDAAHAFADLSTGRLGAVLADVASSDRIVQAIPGLQVVQVYTTSDQYAIAVARTNPNLRDTIDRVLADMRADGTYALIYQKWFQVQPPSS